MELYIFKTKPLRSDVAAELSCEHDKEPEIQHHHLHPTRSVQPIQVLPQSLLSHNGMQSVYSRFKETNIHHSQS